jgi:hypothetical protein
LLSIFLLFGKFLRVKESMFDIHIRGINKGFAHAALDVLMRIRAGFGSLPGN